jgi:hypothetical protein
VIGTLVCCAVFVSLAGKQPLPETVIRLTVDPAPVPKPALRYQLLPELREMTPGNPIPNYLKCMLDQDFSQDQSVYGKAALRQADRAARMDTPDWQILTRLKADGIGLLVPDLQKTRELAAALQGRFREELAARRFDDALVTAKTMFALARHTGEHPTLIGGLVGIAIAQVAITPFEEMLEQPGCPNLYWALTHLPSPLVSLARGMAGERVFMLTEFYDKAGVSATEPMTPVQVRRAVEYLDRLRRSEPVKDQQGTRRWLDERVRDEKHLAAARVRLIDFGIPEDRLAKFPADQVVMLDEVREFEVRRDEAMKFTTLPTWQAVEFLRTLEQPPKGTFLFEGFLPALQRVRLAQGRLEQRVALLRHVEAVRLYAAAHDGKLPATLGDIEVPLPPDPFTGKPVQYEVRDGVAHIRGTPPQGEERNPAYNIHYEITIRK